MISLFSNSCRSDVPVLRQGSLSNVKFKGVLSAQLLSFYKKILAGTSNLLVLELTYLPGQDSCIFSSDDQRAWA